MRIFISLLSNPGGPAPGYNYGHHFLFQGHENSGDLAYVTRINLDVHDRRTGSPCSRQKVPTDSLTSTRSTVPRRIPSAIRCSSRRKQAPLGA